MHCNPTRARALPDSPCDRTACGMARDFASPIPPAGSVHPRLTHGHCIPYRTGGSENARASQACQWGRFRYCRARKGPRVRMSFPCPYYTAPAGQCKGIIEKEKGPPYWRPLGDKGRELLDLDDSAILEDCLSVPGMRCGIVRPFERHASVTRRIRTEQVSVGLENADRFTCRNRFFQCLFAFEIGIGVHARIILCQSH